MKIHKLLLLSFVILSIFLPKEEVFAQSYSAITLTSPTNTKIIAQAVPIEFSAGKWKYAFLWARSTNADGMIMIYSANNPYLPVFVLDPAPKVTNPLNPVYVRLDPSTQYNFRYYTAPSTACDQNNTSTDPECAILVSTNFYTLDSSGNVFSPQTLQNAPSTNQSSPASTDPSTSLLQSQVNRAAYITESLLRSLYGGVLPPSSNQTGPSYTDISSGATPSTPTTIPGITTPINPITGSIASTANPSCSLNSDLRLGDSGASITLLTQILVREGLLLATKATFDNDVFNAVVGYQEKYASSILTPLGLSRGTGFVGPSTRTHINSRQSCPTSGITTNPIGPTITNPNTGGITNSTTTPINTSAAPTASIKLSVYGTKDVKEATINVDEVFAIKFDATNADEMTITHNLKEPNYTGGGCKDFILRTDYDPRIGTVPMLGVMSNGLLVDQMNYCNNNSEVRITYTARQRSTGRVASDSVLIRVRAATKTIGNNIPSGAGQYIEQNDAYPDQLSLGSNQYLTHFDLTKPAYAFDMTNTNLPENAEGFVYRMLSDPNITFEGVPNNVSVQSRLEKLRDMPGQIQHTRIHLFVAPGYTADPGVYIFRAYANKNLLSQVYTDAVIFVANPGTNPITYGFYYDYYKRIPAILK